MRTTRLHLGDDIREIDYAIGDVVYLKMRDDPIRGIVNGYHVRPESILYAVSWGDGNESIHYAMELSRDHVPPLSHSSYEG